MNTEIENKKFAVWAITESGFKHGFSLAKYFDDAVLFVSENLIKKFKGLRHLNKSFCDNPVVFTKLSKKIQNVFNDFDGHIFIFSTGIVVRTIAPLLKSKIEDPAIVVLDDKAIHAISLVSGHIGGANKLTKTVARITKARAVITTATDINNKPAIDIIATENNINIVNPDMIKTINMKLLNNENIKIIDNFNVLTNKLPKYRNVKRGADIICTDIEIDVPRETLILNPLSLIVGMGCNRGTSLEEMEQFLTGLFKLNKLATKSIAVFASIDAKNDETGFLELSKKYETGFLFFSKQEINSVKRIKNPSKTVEKYMGVKSVCEAAAIIAGKNTELIVQKQIKGNVTIAIARQRPCCI